MIDFLILAALWFFGIIVPLGGLILIVRKVIVPYWVKGWSSQWVFWYILGAVPLYYYIFCKVLVWIGVESGAGA
ncbi:hypothetical protein F9047_10415 [Escherichia coli]|nr:hypothetical protein F9047_10415 [Escherichia coli]QQG33483.1 hypothetical protein [Pectobacterium phage PcCB7V]